MALLVMATFLATLIGCASGGRIASKPHTISIFRVVAIENAADPAHGLGGSGPVLTLERLNELRSASGYAVEHLIDAPILDGRFSFDATAAVPYASINADHSTSPAIADRRSGCSLKDTIALQGGGFVISCELYFGVVRALDHPFGSPPLMDSSRLESSARIAVDSPLIVGAMPHADAGDGQSSLQSGRQSDYLVVLLGPQR